MADKMYAVKKENPAELETLKEALLILLRAGLAGKDPEPLPEDVDNDALYRFAKFHGVANLAAYAVLRVPDRFTKEQLAKWEKQCVLNVAKTDAQVYWRDRIIRELTDKGIELLPLKGALLIEMYPQRDFRQMSDLDYLYRPEDRETVRSILTELGFEAKPRDGMNEDVYARRPYVSVEMHRCIYEETTYYPESEKTRAYCDGIWERTSAAEENGFLKELDWTEYYIQMIVHSAKHLLEGGTGIRTIMDTFVFLDKHEGDLDRERVRKVLESLKLLYVADGCERLARAWFGSGEKETPSDLRSFEHTILTSGTYGTENSRIENQLERLESSGKSKNTAKAIWFVRRAFPDRVHMQYDYPVLVRHPVLLPFCWIHRLFSALFHKRDRVKSQIKTMREH